MAIRSNTVVKEKKVNTKEVIEQYNKYVIGNYSRVPVLMVRGEGSYIWSDSDASASAGGTVASATLNTSAWMAGGGVKYVF